MGARRNNATGLAKHLRRHATSGEIRVWKALRRLDEPRFRRQAAFGPYVLDFYAPRWKLCVEIDGPFHDAVRDRIRDEWLAERNVKVLRWPADDLDVEALLLAIEKAIS